MPSSRVLVTASAAAVRPAPLLSIILPVYNEQSTFAVLIERVLDKSIPGIAKELIIVESNSTDGTRELVKRYADHPGVRLILQDRPTGKGNAVRAGLAAATGDLILIQDADLEYDIDDYDELLQPLLDWRSIFILGSRHRGDWKMRRFNDAPITAAVFNLGHVFFTGLINVLLAKNLSDPFTMFKVFRRDAVFGLKFVCNRFDFDHEMVIKLVRKGYNPIELPVNYSARSMAEGKKVSFVKDGLTWLWIDLKLRYGELGDRPH
jgi:glycosyltransferase involved in cell wall biosynthesis